MRGAAFSISARVAQMPATRPSVAESDACVASCSGRMFPESDPMTGVVRMRCDKCQRVETIHRHHSSLGEPRRIAPVVIDPSLVKRSKAATAVTAANRARAKQYAWKRMDGETFTGSVRELVNAFPADLLDGSALHKISKMKGKTLHRGWTLNREVSE